MKDAHEDRFWEPLFGRDKFEQGRGRRGPGPAACRRGDVRWAILSLLAEAPSNGYGLTKTTAAKTSGAWRPSPGLHSTRASGSSWASSTSSGAPPPKKQRTAATEKLDETRRGRYRILAD